MSIMLESDFLSYVVLVMLLSGITYLGGHATTLSGAKSEADAPSRSMAATVTVGLCALAIGGVLFIGGEFWKLEFDQDSLTIHRTCRSSLTLPRADLMAIVDVDTGQKAGNHYLELRFKSGQVERSLILAPSKIQQATKRMAEWSRLDAQERAD